ncbi:MAG TPA: hypothetical protein VLK23_05720, partial [Thermodesulfobacteriota bacterium]|nr:hypothetical protein [Thermodesulfobacteriota bacterium]
INVMYDYIFCGQIIFHILPLICIIHDRRPRSSEGYLGWGIISRRGIVESGLALLGRSEQSVLKKALSWLLCLKSFHG